MVGLKRSMWCVAAVGGASEFGFVWFQVKRRFQFQTLLFWLVQSRCSKEVLPEIVLPEQGSADLITDMVKSCCMAILRKDCNVVACKSHVFLVFVFLFKDVFLFLRNFKTGLIFWQKFGVQTEAPQKLWNLKQFHAVTLKTLVFFL